MIVSTCPRKTDHMKTDNCNLYALLNIIMIVASKTVEGKSEYINSIVCIFFSLYSPDNHLV